MRRLLVMCQYLGGNNRGLRSDREPRQRRPTGGIADLVRRRADPERGGYHRAAACRCKWTSRSATASKSESNKSAYASSVIAALAWPSIRWTTLTLAPALIARDAAVCRSACAVIRGNVGSAAWQRATAPDSHDSVDDGVPRYPPSADGHLSSSRPLPSAVAASASTTTAASTTVRFFPLLSVPTWCFRPTVTALRCSTMRRRLSKGTRDRATATDCYSPGYQRPGVVHSGPGGGPSAGHMYLSGNLTHVGGSG